MLTCPTGKRRYGGWTRAATALKRLKRRRKHPSEVRVYMCPECHDFHLASTKTRKGAA